MTRTVHPSGAELVAYQDRALAGHRLARIDDHLRTCSTCRQRLRDAEDIGQLLRDHTPIVHDPAGIAAVRARVGAALDAQAAPAGRSRRWQPVLLLVTLLIVVVTAVQATTSVADFPLGRVITFTRDEEPEREILPAWATPPGIPLDVIPPPPGVQPALSFTPVAPELLPLDLRLTGTSTLPSSVQLRYSNDQGLVLMLLEADSDGTTVTARLDTVELLAIEGVEVAVEHDAVDNIARLLWEHQGIVFELVVLKTPPEDITKDDAVSVAEAIIRQSAADGD
jgi:hypothetical protein